MLMRNERLAELQSHYDDHSHILTIHRHGRDGRAAQTCKRPRAAPPSKSFSRPIFPTNSKALQKSFRAEDHSFSDVAKKVVSIINLASLAAIENMIGLPVHPLRFRANLYVSGWPAWHEFELMGHALAIGEARLNVVKRITRCAAINVDPVTAARDLDIPSEMMRRLNHTDCGVYAEVIAGGSIGVGDAIATEQPRLM